MTRVITITSGKGGVGKTSLVTNLGVALGKLGKRVIMIDLDIQMANLALMVGMEGRPITIQDILVDEANVVDGLYDLQSNVKVLPAKLSTDKIERIPPNKLGGVLEKIKERLSPDFILLDTAPGMGDEVIIPLKNSTETIIVTMPETISVADSMKMVMLAERRLTMEVTGAVVNMTKGLKEEMKPGEIQKTLGTDIIGVIPEDPDMRRSSMSGVPVMQSVPDAPSSIAIMNIAAKLAGVKAPTPEKRKKKGLIDKIREFFESLTKKKKKLPEKKDLKMK